MCAPLVRAAGHTWWRARPSVSTRVKGLRDGSVSLWSVFPVTQARQPPPPSLVLRAGGQQPRAAVEAGDNLAVGEGRAVGNWMVRYRQRGRR